MSETLSAINDPASKSIEGVQLAIRYLREQGVSRSFKSVYSRQARWFRITTEDRLLYAAHAQPLGDLLTAEGFTVSVDRGWRWLRGAMSPRPDGLSSCKTQYGLFVSPCGSRHPKPFARETICLSLDLRADRSIDELLEDAGVDRCLDRQIRWTEKGFFLSCRSKNDAELLAGIFPDCDPKIHRQKASCHDVDFTFPI